MKILAFHILRLSEAFYALHRWRRKLPRPHLKLNGSVRRQIWWVAVTAAVTGPSFIWARTKMVAATK